MTDLTAPGWRLATVGDLVLPVGAVDPASLSSSTFDYIDIGSINNEVGFVERPRETGRSAAPSRARMEVRTGDILFSTVRPYLRAIAQVPPLAHPIASTGFCVLRPAEGVNARYLFHWLRSDAFIESLLPLQRGSSYPAVGDADVLGRSIPLPPSLEQARIAESLDELLGGLHDGVRQLLAAKRTLVLYRESLLKSAVDGSLTVDWRRRHLSDLKPVQFEPVGFSGTLPKLPASWGWQPLETLLSERPQNGLYLPSERYGDGLPILRINDYQVNFVPERSVLRCVRGGDSDANRYGLMPGDLVVNRVNSLTHLGKCIAIPPSLNGVLFESNLMKLKLQRGVSADYVANYLGSAVGRARLIERAKWAVNQASINQQDVCRTPVPVPPFEEQLEVVRLLEGQLIGIAGQKVAIEKSLAMAAAQRQNILRAAFSGRLVPQDLNDEPASVLLDRIRTAREASAAAKPRARGRTAARLAG